MSHMFYRMFAMLTPALAGALGLFIMLNFPLLHQSFCSGGAEPLTIPASE